MYRSLSLYPKSADPVTVEAHIREVAAVFAASPGFLATTTSVGALMGPGAKVSDVGQVVVTDFATLDDALGALSSEAFAELREISEGLTVSHYLFECTHI